MNGGSLRYAVSGHRDARLRWLLIAGMIAGFALSALPARVGMAAGPIQVNSTLDRVSNSDGLCTLREAIIAANKDTSSGNAANECGAGSGADTIIVPAGVYTLTRTDNGKEDSSSTGDLDITGSVVISPTGVVTIAAPSGFKDRIFHILSGSVTISGTTISGGNVSGYGGGIYLNNGSLTLSNVTLTGNFASDKGGGVANSSIGLLAISNSAIISNTATNQGGGLYNAGPATLTNATISGNKVTQTPGSNNGGGIYNNSGNASLTNVTLNANTGGNLLRLAGTFTLKNTVVANAVSGGNCSGTLSSLGNNLSSDSTCSSSLSQATDLNNTNPLLGPLQNNGGPTLTHALALTSPAVDRGTNAGCPVTDQRGLPRPSGAACDIGAFEVQDPLQAGPIFTVNSSDDPGDGVCTYAHCTLREAINAANARPNDSASTPDQIVFNIPGNTIQPASALPAFTAPVIIDGGGTLLIDGSRAGTADGLTFSAGDSTVRGVTISNFSGAGVSILSGSGTVILDNSIVDNNGLGIDLGGDGVTPNDPGDADTGPNGLQNHPVLFRAVQDAGGTTIDGRLNSTANAAYTIRFFSNTTCDPSGYGEGQTFLGSKSATTDDTGDVYFKATFATAVPEGEFVTATATDANGNTSEFSRCVRVGLGNDAWVGALRLTLTGDSLSRSASFEQLIDAPGQSRWFKFAVQPGSKLKVELTGLPANYDLTVYKDIAAAFDTLTTPQDLVRLGAEFAPDAYSPDAYSPDAYSPDAYSPDAYSPDAYSPDAYSPDAYSPDAYSPDAYSPDAYSPDAYSPDAYSPDAYSPDAYSPDAYSPDAYSPDHFSPDAYSSAQTRSLIGVSAFEGTAGEGVVVNTWDNSTDFYVRVRGRNSASSLAAPFHLSVTQLAGSCAPVSAALPASDIPIIDAQYKTIILTDLSRTTGTISETAALTSALDAFKIRPEVAGIVVDVGSDARVAVANAQADAHANCPYAKNLVASAIKDIVDRYRNVNPLEYVVIVGDDSVIPFFRHPDHAMLANEKNYVPPVRDATSSQASLKLGYVLSQDDYGAKTVISVKDDNLPIPGLAVGRLVETASDATTMLNAYVSAGGVVAPRSSLVTGYDFLEDVARQVQFELEQGTGQIASTLILTRDVSPADPLAWTADDLRTELLGSRHDMMFLAGHFSANSALAADYATRLFASEVANSSLNLTNAIVFSPGCHAGYNIVNAHGVPLVTREPDWAQAFARKGVTLVAGTGYQYGDTDFVEYSERLYLNLAQQLRTGEAAVPLGKALVVAKQQYLAETPELRGIHEKAYLEATLFGLPMLSVNLPGARLIPQPEASIVSMTDTYTADPGKTLGLSSADVSLVPSLTPHTRILSTVGTTETVTAMYLSGSDGVVANPAEPVLPLEVRRAGVPGVVLRGAGFLGGDYVDQDDVRPLTGAATTEVRGVHIPALSSVFFPIQPWSINSFEALAEGTLDGSSLVVLPAQFRSAGPISPTGTLRKFATMDFRLYYSSNISPTAVSGPPDIIRVSSSVSGDNATFQINVVGNPAAGVQEVWVTYTGLSGALAGKWRSLPLAQDAADSTLWTGTLTLGGVPSADVRYIVQAANGLGLVSLATNIGAYYVPGVEAQPTQPTSIAIENPPTSGAYGTKVNFSAKLTNSGMPLAGQALLFRLGPESRIALTGDDGRATAALPLLGLPGADELRVSFAGTAEYIASTATRPFTINKQATQITLSPQNAATHLGSGALMTATLTDATGRPLGEKTVFFVVTGGTGSLSVPEITDYAGRATLRDLSLPFGTYTVKVTFGGAILLSTGETVTVNDDRYQPSSATGSLARTNAAPVANADAYSVNEGSTLNVAAPGVLGNDSDADGDPITASLATAPAHGSLTLNADGSFSYTPNVGFSGTDTFTYSANDGLGGSTTATVTITVIRLNRPPDCSEAHTNPVSLWPVDKTFYPISIIGVTDPDGDPLSIVFRPVSPDPGSPQPDRLSPIWQDEPVRNDGDAHILGPNLAELRADRDGNGDGRWYHIFFTASDGRGGSCNGVVRLGVVPHDQSNDFTTDGGALFDSTSP